MKMRLDSLAWEALDFRPALRRICRVGGQEHREKALTQKSYVLCVGLLGGRSGNRPSIC
jgi:hypothetical protein